MQTIDFTNEIKSRVSSKEAFLHYGIELDRSGFCKCFLTGERTASLKVYDGDRGWYCFGCGAHGSVIDFVMRYFNLTFRESISKLNGDFNLGLPIGEKLDRRKQIEIAKKSFAARKEREKERAELNRLKDAREKALDEWIRLDNQKMEYKPKSEKEDLHPLFLEAIINLSHAEYRLECAETELYLYEKRNSCNT